MAIIKNDFINWLVCVLTGHKNHYRYGDYGTLTRWGKTVETRKVYCDKCFRFVRYQYRLNEKWGGAN